MTHQYIDVKAVEKALAAKEEEREDLKRRQGVIRVQIHRLRKLLAAAQEAQK